MYAGMMLLFILTIALMIAGYSYTWARTGTLQTVPLGSRFESFNSELSPAEVVERLAAGVPGFAIDDVDRDDTAVLLSTKPTFATWGFFYPVHVAADGRGGSEITVGIKSKLFQFGPLVTKWHRQCLLAVQTTVG